MTHESLDAAIIALARRQHGVVTTAQLLGAGFDDSAVARPDPLREQPRDPPAQSLRLTSPAQTLEQLTGADYERAHNEALIRQLVPGDGRETMTRSEAERRVLALDREGRPALSAHSVKVHGHEVDLHWPEHRLVVEFDGWAYHSSGSSRASRPPSREVPRTSGRPRDHW